MGYVFYVCFTFKFRVVPKRNPQDLKILKILAVSVQDALPEGNKRSCHVRWIRMKLLIKHDIRYTRLCLLYHSHGMMFYIWWGWHVKAYFLKKEWINATRYYRSFHVFENIALAEKENSQSKLDVATRQPFSKSLASHENIVPEQPEHCSVITFFSLDKEWRIWKW